ncbi:MAG TPA: hypothetical protein VFM12_03910 [Gemmatimonadales bacterium]|jgi:hypothetical protein|nr:hypothetical protein [Gemmatimonadales bacterium]
MRRILLSPLLLFLPVLSLSAQGMQCEAISPLGGARQTCLAAVDLARAYFPLAGMVLSGGNPVLAEGGTSGRAGAVTLTFRVNGFHLHVPDLTAIDADGTVHERSSVLAPVPVVEAQVGIFPGLSNGFLSIDGLGSVQLVPNEDFAKGLRADSDAVKLGPVSLGFGLGARVGVMNETDVRPSLALSVMHRRVPRVGYGDVNAGDRVQADANLNAWNLRGTAGKRFGLLMIAAGAGWDHYSGRANGAYNVSALPGGQGTISLPLDQSRWMGFVDGGLAFGVFRLTGEIGYQFGVDQHLDTTFEGYDDTAGSTFYSLGLQLGF